MFAALTLFIVLTLSVLVIRTAAVALRITGLPEEVARFQARSAFTGTGFTTSEAEAILSHPARRRIVSLLMVVGSLGLVSVLATVIVSLVGSSDSEGALLNQLLWLAGVLFLLWCVALNPKADRVMCAAIGRLLRDSRSLKPGAAELLLQCPGGHGVYRLRPAAGMLKAGAAVGDLLPPEAVALDLHRADGSSLQRPAPGEALGPLDEIYAYGPDRLLAGVGGPGVSPRENRG